MKHFLSITDLSPWEITHIIDHAIDLKKTYKTNKSNWTTLPFLPLQGNTFAMFFQKPSLRTRLSFEAGIYQLWGHGIYLDQQNVWLWVRESLSDIATVTSSLVDGIIARTYAHSTLQEMAHHSSVPVINALSDLEHPCQILADLMTIFEHFWTFKWLKISYIWDCDNNITNSLCLACALLDVEFACAWPEWYMISPQIISQAYTINPQFVFSQDHSPQLIAKDAHVIVTDTRVSMGYEDEKSARISDLEIYKVTQDLMGLASSDAIFLHCLPAYRESEVTAWVIDWPASRVFQEAENRLHAQKALLSYIYW